MTELENNNYILTVHRDPNTGLIVLGESYNPRTGVETDFTIINEAEAEHVTIMGWLQHCEDRIAEKTELA